MAPERRRIGYVPQEGSLFPHLTVAGNVGFGLTASQRRRGQVDAMLTTVGLAGFGLPSVTLRARGPVFAWPAY